MNNKGQVGVGAILIMAISVIVGVILFTAVAQQVGTTTNTATVSNLSIGTATNGTTLYITTYRAITSPVIVNSTNGAAVSASYYTITNNVVYNGALAVSVLPTSPSSANLTSYEWNISGTGQPLTYIPDSGGRALVGMIVIFFALAIAVVALTPVLKDGLLSAIGR